MCYHTTITIITVIVRIGCKLERQYNHGELEQRAWLHTYKCVCIVKGLAIHAWTERHVHVTDTNVSIHFEVSINKVNINRRTHKNIYTYILLWMSREYYAYCNEIFDHLGSTNQYYTCILRTCSFETYLKKKEKKEIWRNCVTQLNTIQQGIGAHVTPKEALLLLVLTSD